MRFTRLKIGQSETKELTVKNGINEPSIIGAVAGPFSFVSLKEITGEFPASSTIYFRENYVLQNESGDFATTDQGHGVAGSTDENKKFTPNFALPSLTLDSPLESAKVKLNETITVKWTANNITLINIVIESATGIKTVKNIDATLGTYDVDLTADAGDFWVNQEITITVENVVRSIADSADISSIATVTINTPTLTAGTEGNITGTSNGVEVDVYYRVSSPEGAWEVFKEGVAVSGGQWSATGTIADAGTYDFIAEDTTDSRGYAEQTGVEVVSGELIIDNFESYANGENLISLGYWTKTTGNDLMASNETPYEGTMKGVVSIPSSSTASIVKTFTRGNYNGKKLSWAHKTTNATADPNTYIVVSLYDGTTLRQTMSTLRVADGISTSWVKFEQNITYNGNIDKIQFQIGMRWSSSNSIDSIKIV